MFSPDQSGGSSELQLELSRLTKDARNLSVHRTCSIFDEKEETNDILSIIIVNSIFRNMYSAGKVT